MFTVVSYDISDDRRRNRISHILEDYGDRVQFSVFECNLSKSQFKRLWSRLKESINPQEDNLRFYQICETCFSKIRVSGNVPLSTEPNYYLI